MWERSVSRSARTAGRARWGLSWTAGLLAVTASACAHGIEPLGPGESDGSNGVAGSTGIGGSIRTGGSAGGGTNATSGTGGAGGSAGDMVVDITGGSAGTALDDGSAGVTADASEGDAYDAGSAVKDAAPDAPCPSGGKALSFDGTSRVDIPGTSLPITNSPRTIEMWISPATIAAPAWSPNHTLFEYGSGNLGTFALDMDVFPMMELYPNPAANSFFFNTGIAQVSWFHVASTYDGATTTRAFVNGADKGSKTLTGPLVTTLTAVGIGGTSSARYFIGSIDEVRVWNVARTAAEIQQTMSVRLTGTEAGLVGYWRFDEASGTTVSDSSTKGITGAFVGPVTRVASGVTLTCR